MKILWENPVLFFLRNSDSTNGNRCAGFCPRGYVSVAEAVSSTDVEDNKSGADEVQELLPEMRKGEEKEEHFRRRRLHANPGIGSRKHRVLRRRQVKIEAEAWELATKEYKELLKDMCDLLKS
jgi:DNA-directed RNA polymerase